MERHEKKLFRWVLGGGITCLALLILALIIERLIFDGNTQQYNTYITYICAATMLVYVTISAIKIARYKKHVNNYLQERLEKSKKELTTEYKQVFLKYSDTIYPELFKCQAKIDEDGKIVCEISLEHEIKFESCEEFLTFFRFSKE